MGLIAAAYRSQSRDVLVGWMVGIAWQATIIAAPLVTARAIDAGIIGGDTGELALWSLIIAACVVLEAVLTAVRHRYAFLPGVQASNWLQSGLLRRIHRAPYKQYRSAGSVVSTATNDARKVGTLVEFTPGTVSMGLAALVVTTIVCVIDPWICAAVVVPLIPLAAVYWYLSRMLSARSRAVQDLTAEMSGLAESSVSGQRSVVGLGLGPGMRRWWSTGVGELFANSMRLTRFSAAFDAALQIFQTVALLLALVVGAVRLADGAISVGELLAVVQYTTMLGPYLIRVGSYLNRLQSTKASAARVTESGAGHTHGYDDLWSPGTTSVAVACEDVSLDGMSVQNWSADFTPGRITAVLTGDGPELAGLARILAGHERPQSGQVLVDGRPLSSDRHAVVVSREDFLFTASVRDNLTFGDPGATDSQLATVLRIAAADRVIEVLPEGLDTMVQPRATNLSGGQRQRLCLARALLAHPDVLILADALAALDPTTATEVIGNLRSCGCTVILLTREPSLARQADRVLDLPSKRGFSTRGVHR